MYVYLPLFVLAWIVVNSYILYAPVMTRWWPEIRSGRADYSEIAI